MEKELDILFVNVGSASKRVYQDLSKDYSAIEPPFWAALTAGFIRKKGYNVDILDANAENMTHKETAEFIKSRSPKLVNIIVFGQQPASSTQLMPSVSALCKEIKQIDTERKIILTGLHPSALPERTLKDEECDFIGQGEGFYTILALVEGKSLEQIPGLYWQENNQIKNNPRPMNVSNLTEELSEVAWDLLPLNQGKYRAHNHQCLGEFHIRQHYASLSTSLGCPFRCHFCSISATFGGERGIRYWSPEWVLKQIDILVKEYNVKVIKIIDEMFLFDSHHFLTIAEGLIERNYDLNIWAYARVDTTKTLDMETLKKLRKAGFKWLCFGFEAASDSVRTDVQKGMFSEEDMIELVKKVKQADISILANFMFGLPEDALESMQKTLNFAQKLNCEFLNIYCTMAYPGSNLYQEAVEKGWKLPSSWADYSQHSYGCQPLPTNHISAEEVLRFRDYAFDVYFKNPLYLNMIEKRFGQEARKHIQEMTKTKLKRRLLGD